MTDTNSINTGIINSTVLISIIMLTSFFNAFMAAAVNIAIPDIAKEYDMDAVTISWVAMSFLLSAAIFLVPFGKLADIFGRKKLFLTGNIIFASSSVLCVFSVSGEMLIVIRFIQGIGSAMIMSTGMAIVISAFPPQKRGRMLGLVVSAVYIGLTLAPVLGGMLTQSLGWRSIFVVNAIAGAAVILGVILKVKAEWAEAKNESFDVPGALVYMVSMFVLMYGFSKLPKEYAIIMVVAGLAGMTGFVIIESRARYPVLNTGLFGRNRVFAFSNLAALINYAATFAITFVLSLYLQYVKGLEPRDAGLILITQPAVMALTAGIAGRLSDKYDSRILASLGMAVIVAGLALLYFLDTKTENIYIITSLVIVGLGFGFFSTPNTNSIMSSVEKRFLGVASATQSTMRITGQMMSMAIAAMIMHMLIGDEKITKNNTAMFMKSAQIIFLVFAFLCFLGIFASLARGKKENQEKNS
ncbi:MAG: MFS transporter [Bacteroidota bacterium]